jgi:hypothetical protein
MAEPPKRMTWYEGVFYTLLTVGAFFVMAAFLKDCVRALRSGGESLSP